MSPQPAQLRGVGGVQKPQSPYNQEVERVRPIIHDKINNFIGAMAGSPPPNEDVRWQSQGMLQDIFDLNLNDSVKEYAKYTQSNPIKRKLTDLMVHGVVGAKMDSYINNILNNKLPGYETVYGSPDADEGIKYQRSILSGLRNLMQDRNTRGEVMKHLTDFRTLEQPIPLVQSRITYPR